MRAIDLPPGAWLLVSAFALAAAAALGLRQFGPEPLRTPERVDLGASEAAVLDTASVRGRRVSASLSGWVADLEGERDVWLADPSGFFRIVLPEVEDAQALRIGDRLLVTGRLAERDGRRALRAEAWAGPLRDEPEDRGPRREP